MQVSLECSKCNSNLKEEDIFCPNCGYPENADQKEKDKYAYRIKLKSDVVQDAKKKLKNVKILLYVIAGINFLIGIYYLSNEMTFADGIGSLISGFIFLGCVFWVNKQPLTGILAAFIFWIILQLSVIFIDPSLLFRGIIIKIVIIGVFIKGINSAKDFKSYSEQLKEMNAL